MATARYEYITHEVFMVMRRKTRHGDLQTSSRKLVPIFQNLEFGDIVNQ
jgi:hypothetical protein